MRRYFPFAKVDAERREVWGYASTEARDDQGEIIRREALVAALGDYLRFANIREMHQLSAVGVAKEAGIDDKGLYIGARIVDRDAWEKVVEGVYKGYSIGGRVTERDPDDRHVITGLVLTEISLVDRPANPEAVFDYFAAAKAASPTAEPGLVTLAETEAGQRLVALAQPVQVWACRDPGHRHLAKAEAARCLEARPAAAASEALGKAEARGTGRLPHGAVDYADPGYQPDGRKRYPIDTEAHIRAAWAYINHPRNAEKYTPAQLDRITARIAAAWKEKIDKDGPPAALPADAAQKSLCDAGRVAQIILELDWLDGQLATEAAIEGDDSPQPARLRAIVAELCRFLNALVAEETGEILADLGETPPSDTVTMAAAGVMPRARHHLAKLLASERRDNALLLKSLTELAPRLDALAKRVDEIAATPLPPLTVAKGTTAVSKQGDGAGGGEMSSAGIAAAFARMSKEEQTLALIKASYANPMRMP